MDQMTLTGLFYRRQTAITILPLLIVILLAGLHLAPVQSQAVQRPLTLEGKQALYQRVIAVPDAKLAMERGGIGTESVTPFTVFYVYARDTQDGTEWLQVGSKNNGVIDGWLPAAQGIDWKQNLTVSFKDPAVQDRVLLFGDRSSLTQLVDANNVDTYRELQQRAEQGITTDSPVIAIQPDHFINIRRNFYLVPILSHEDVLIGNYPGRLLQVATVPLQDPVSGYRAGVMFAIDTTISMGPYIIAPVPSCSVCTRVLMLPTWPNASVSG
jgi:serine/threonine-protein kinase PpkA